MARVPLLSPESDPGRPTRVRVSAPVPERKADEAFSALELRDRVVIMLLFDQIVTEEQVAQVWDLWQQEYRRDIKTPLWRLLTLIPELDPEMILAEAARVHGIEEARISRRLALPLIERTAEQVPKDVWETMVHLRLLPIGDSEQAHSHRMRILLASHDPTHPDVQQVLPRLGLNGHELRYATELELVALLAESFPWKYGKLPEEVEQARARFTRSENGAAQEPATAGSADDDDPALKKSPNTASIIAFFEDLLVEAVRQQATGICLAPPNDDVTEIFFQIDGGLDVWRVVDHISPAALLHTVQHAILRGEIVTASADRHEIKRWIDGKPIRFRLSMMPAGDLLHRKALLIRLLTPLS